MDLASINNPFLGRNPPQFGYATGVQNSLYRSTSAHVLNVYGSKVNKMPGTWDLFKTVIICTRRSNNPSLKRPGIPVAPE